MTNSRATKKLHFVIVKNSDETVNSSTTLQNDNDLFFNAQANKTYIADLILWIKAGTTCDIKYGWSMPSGCVLSVQNATNDPNVLQSGTATNPDISLAGSGSSRTIRQYVKFVMSTTSGTINFEWAQNTSDAENCTVEKGTTMVVYSS